MNYKRLLPQVVGLILIALLLIACGGPSEVAGTLTNQASGEPLAGARVVLCQFTGDKTCVVQPNLTAVTDEKGKFRIPDVESGKYVVLYNGSGEKLVEWDELEIEFTPVQGQMGPSVIQGILKSLGVRSLSGCATQITIGGMDDFRESSYLYVKKLDLALILVENEPVSVKVGGKETINLSVWSTQEEECDNENFDPVQ